ncbi:MAG: hypothetical protein MR529_10790, partial [Cuneatibacter sp.]|nr:hypothetical protein [Cuneatibacter sp.]
MKRLQVFGAAVLVGILALTSGCGAKKDKEVVVYTAVDEVFAEDVIHDFEQETGIKVNVVYDTEANKTT